MRIINKTSSSRYLGLIDRTVGPKQRTPDRDPKGFRAALQEILRKLGPSYTIQLTSEERKLINELLKLDAEGQKFKFDVLPPTRPTVSAYLLDATRREKIEQEKRIVEVREREAAIRAETTYASRKDKEDAHAASRKIRGEVVAKKLASTGAEEVSLSDLMGDNRFIEEHLKDSKISMDISNTDGWKVPENDAPVTEEHVKALEAQLPPDGKEPNPFVPDAPDAADAPEEVQRKRKGRKSRKNRSETTEAEEAQ